jgi:TfoX/Sxy family transcriptional regulator of competence genes
MAAEQSLVDDVRAQLSSMDGVTEVRMFGGLAFLLSGNMVTAVSKRGLLVRVGKGAQQEALTRPGARPMEMRGRVMPGYIYVDPAALSKDTLRAWLDDATRFVQTLPPKTEGDKATKRGGNR